MTYFAMARRFRPQNFSQVAAQSHITETLQRAIETDRVAPAYLFTGPRGSGKTTVARLLAKAVNCEHRKKGEPCSKCEACIGTAEGRSMDVLEIDGASNNSVEDVRELRENVRYAASAPGKRKVYIIDEVHMLSTGAFNALLKTLEEPPGHVLFVFATTEVRKVPATILSRCQRFDFRRLLTEEIQDRLQLICKKEKLDIEDAALFLLAKRADGSLRDGLSLLDQVISSTSGRIQEAQVAEVLGLVREETYLDLTQAILEHDSVHALELLHSALQEGADPGGFALGLVEHLRNLLLLSVDAGLRSAVQLGDAHLKRAEELAEGFRTEDLLYLLNRAAAVHEDARRLSNPSVVLEAAVVELARFESRVVLSQVLEKLEGGSGPSVSASAAPPGRRGSKRDASGSRASASSASASRGAAPPAARLDVPPSSPPAPSSGPSEIRSSGATHAVDSIVAGGPPTLPGAASGTLTQGPAVGAALEIGVVREQWEDFTRVVQDRKAMLAHCLSEGVPKRLHATTLHLEFSAEHTFHMNLLRERATIAELEEQLHSYFGKRLKVALHEEGSDVELPEPSSPNARLTAEDIAASRLVAAKDVLESNPRLQEIVDAFDGEILEDNES